MLPFTIENVRKIERGREETETGTERKRERERERERESVCEQYIKTFNSIK